MIFTFSVVRLLNALVHADRWLGSATAQAPDKSPLCTADARSPSRHLERPTCRTNHHHHGSEAKRGTDRNNEDHCSLHTDSSPASDRGVPVPKRMDRSSQMVVGKRVGSLQPMEHQ